MIFRILLSNFSDILPAFTCISAIGYPWSICLVVNILISSPWNDACVASDTIVE